MAQSNKKKPVSVGAGFKWQTRSFLFKSPANPEGCSPFGLAKFFLNEDERERIQEVRRMLDRTAYWRDARYKVQQKRLSRWAMHETPSMKAQRIKRTAMKTYRASYLMTTLQLALLKRNRGLR